MNHPDTIKYPETFDKSQWHITCPYCKETIGFDGIFHWGWTQGCFGDTKIALMDLDGVVERYRHYLVFETKDPDKEIPQGQLITLEGLKTPKDFCVMKIWGKNEPERFEATYLFEGRIREKSGEGVNEARDFVKRWYEWANKNR